jgi:hypothetical protein
MHEISAEICGLLDQQAELLDSRPTLSALNAEEVDVYAHRNDLLYELYTRLIEVNDAPRDFQSEEDSRRSMSDLRGCSGREV